MYLITLTKNVPDVPNTNCFILFVCIFIYSLVSVYFLSSWMGIVILCYFMAARTVIM